MELIGEGLSKKEDSNFVSRFWRYIYLGAQKPGVRAQPSIAPALIVVLVPS